jgi:hypothetical protein
MQAAGLITSSVGSILQGFQERSAANVEADDLNSSAKEQLASGQRGYAVAQRQTQLVQSRAKALAAGSGAGASDPTVQNIQADIGREGEYDALTQLYNGESASRALRYQASMTKYAGSQAFSSGLVKGLFGDQASMGLGGQGVSLMQKYGGQLPSWMGGSSDADIAGSSMMVAG